jgi:hypothetical protein
MFSEGIMSMRTIRKVTWTISMKSNLHSVLKKEDLMEGHLPKDLMQSVLVTNSFL